MIRKYNYEYDMGTASAVLEFDEKKIDENLTKELYNFFSWTKYDEPEGDLLDKLAFHYARQAIRFATMNNHNLNGVLSDFKDAEGFPEMDGTYGYKLVSVEGIDLSELELEKV